MLKYLIPVLNTYLDWHKWHIEEKKEDDYSWHDMATGLRAARLALCLNIYLNNQKADITSNDLDKLIFLGEIHMNKIVKLSDSLARNNHQLHICLLYTSPSPRD